MSLQRKTRSVKKVVAILTDPHPEFASLVQYPANQTPFTVVKSSPAELEAATQDMALKAASTVVDIHQIAFSKNHPSFKTVEAVAEYLDNNGYENFQINDEGNFFIVPGRAEDEFEGDLENVKIQKGISMTMGRLRPARKSAASETVVRAAEAARTEAAEGLPETSTKSMYHVGRFAELLESIGYLASSLSYEDNYEEDKSPIPAALREWLQTGASIFKNLADEEVSEFITHVQSHKAAATERASKAKDTTVAETAAPKTTPVAAPAKAPTSVQANTDPKTVTGGETTETPAATPGTPPTAVPDVAATPPTSATPPETSTVVTDVPADTVTPPAETTTDTVAPGGAEEAVKAAAPAGIDTAALLAGLGEVFANALNPVAKQLTELTERVSKSEERVETIEAGTRQSRKSIGDPDTTSAPNTQTAADLEETKKAEQFAARQARNRMGL